MSKLVFRYRAVDHEHAETVTGYTVFRSGGLETVDDLRRRLAVACQSSVAEAAQYEPELWSCDAAGRTGSKQHAPLVTTAPLLSWTADELDDVVRTLTTRGADPHCHQVFLLFTFPPILPPSPPLKRPRRAAQDGDWATLKGATRTFFERLSCPGALVPGRHDYLDLPVHPSIQASSASRFETKELKDSTLVIPLLSRDLAATLATAMLSRCDGGVLHNYMYIHGAMGAGKSYALYEAVCRLMMTPNMRVVYMSDCSAWSDIPSVAAEQLAKTVAHGFHPERDAPIWQACAEVTDATQLSHLLAETLPQYCHAIGCKFLVVFDQHHGLSPKQRENPPWSMVERDLPAWPRWKGLGATVIAASAKNDYTLQVAAPSKWMRVDWFDGFSDDEFTCWQAHHAFLTSAAQADALENVRAILGTWPLHLNALRRKMEALSPAAALTEYLQVQCLILSGHERSHVQNRLADPADRDAYRGLVLDMLIERGAVLSRHAHAPTLINQHLLYVHKETIRPIHEVARQFYLSLGYGKARTLLDVTAKQVFSEGTVSDTTQGCLARLYIVACLTDAPTVVLSGRRYTARLQVAAKREPIFDGGGLRRVDFREQVPASADWRSNLLLVPTNPSAQGADLFLWDASARLLVALQVTVSNTHALTFNLNLEERWKAASNAAAFKFVWAAPRSLQRGPKADHYFVDFATLAKAGCPLLHDR